MWSFEKYISFQLNEFKSVLFLQKSWFCSWLFFDIDPFLNKCHNSYCLPSPTVLKQECILNSRLFLALILVIFLHHSNRKARNCFHELQFYVYSRYNNQAVVRVFSITFINFFHFDWKFTSAFLFFLASIFNLFIQIF